MVQMRPFTALATEKELILLKQLHAMLEADPVVSREGFSDMMAVAFANGRLEARALSDDMGYNFSTVYRWIDGRTAPHRSQWPQVQAWVRDALEWHIDAAKAHASELAEA